MPVSRKIPSVMFSQHPDHAGTPFWHDRPFIATHHEVNECYLMFKKLGAEEVMWDWEGKLADESVVERLLAQYPEFFKKNILGRDLFLTFRVPNPRLESGYRLARAYMVILWAQHLTDIHEWPTPPLFEIILPMAESAPEMIRIQKNFQRFAKAAAASFARQAVPPQNIEVIPTFERIPTIMKSPDILRQYIKLHKKTFGHYPSYIRPFCARSDPALNSGIVPTTLAIKWALSEYARFTRATSIPTYPIIAPGALPFRGGLTPSTAAEFAAEFAGVKTIVIQSSFRYDYPIKKVQNAVRQLIKIVPRTKAKMLSPHIRQEIEKIIPWFAHPYQQRLEQIARLIEPLSVHIPPRRERVLHIGLFGYSRDTKKFKLPRAIGFTASCYSLGLPPELFGVGAGLTNAIKEDKMKIIEMLYKNLRPSLIRAGRYLRKESIAELGLKDFGREITVIENYLGDKLGPQTASERQHAQLVTKIIAALRRGREPKKEIAAAALLRRSLG